MPEISFPSATDTPPRIDYTTTPWNDPVNGGKWLWTESLSAWNPKQFEVFDQEALDVGINPNTLTITGITSPAGSDPLVLELGGTSYDADGNITLRWGGYDIQVGSTYGVWMIRIVGSGYPYLYEATKISSAKTPVGLTDWTIITGAGQPILEGNDKFPSYIGQLGTAHGPGFEPTGGPPWFRWDGNRWREDIGNPLRLGYTPVSDRLYIEAGLTSNIPTSIPALTLQLGNPTISKHWNGSASGVGYFMTHGPDGSWEFESTDYPTSYKARSVSTTDASPIDVTTWTVLSGTGQPVVTGTVASPPIDTLGKTALVSSGSGSSLWSAVSWGEWAEITNTTAAGMVVIESATAPTDLTVGWQDPETGIVSYYVGGGWVAQSANGSSLTLGVGVEAALAKSIGTNGAPQLQGDPLTPTSIILPDVTSIVPPLNSIGVKHGRITVGDGVKTGGIPVQARTMKGMLQFNTTTQPITGAFTRIASLPIFPQDFAYAIAGNTSPFKIYGEVTLNNSAYSTSIKDWGIGFCYDGESLLPKSNKWLYGSMHPAPGTSKNLTWSTSKILGDFEMYHFGDGTSTPNSPGIAYRSYGATYTTGVDAVVTNSGTTMPSSGEAIITRNTGGNLWLMVHAEKMTGQPVGGSVTVTYDVTIEFP